LESTLLGDWFQKRLLPVEITSEKITSLEDYFQGRFLALKITSRKDYFL
jgi:hypothetical protein